MTWRLTKEALAKWGQAPALRGLDGRSTSYRALVGRSQAVADLLVSAGIGAGDRVALMSTGRDHDEAIGLVGIRLAGAVVVPLDPSHPPARRAAIAEGCRALVVDESTKHPPARLPRVELDGDGFVLGAQGDAEEAAGGDPTLTAVLHTSGSTGRPKAIPIATGGLSAFTSWMIELVGVDPGTRILRVAELGFDLAWFDHLATLRAGGTLCTMPRRSMASGRALRDAVERLRPEVIYGVPSFFQKLVEAGCGFEGVRILCFAGEVYPMAGLRRLAGASDARLINLFGPTETNVCTYHEVRPEDLNGEELPIGQPSPYARCTLVDGEKVVEGDGIGELVVEGPTAMGGRCRTRDRVERRDGQFWFRGRLDRMVKIRGFRVDPGEVEAALHGCSGVSAAAVVVGEHARLGTVLVGHVEGEVDARELRKTLAAKLPMYMVPERIECHGVLPRTATGKLDYASLR